MKKTALFAAVCLLGAAAAAAQESKGKTIEDIAARVKNEIITLSDLARARAVLLAEVDEECRRGCKPEERENMIKERERALLSDLIDQSLLVQQAKDAGITVEADLVKQLDQIRQQNNIPTLEDLEKAVRAQGIDYEEWKANLRNRMLTQEVIRKEVGSRMLIGDADVKKYYEEHKDEFVRPERVFLSEIFVSTEGKSEEEIPALEQKAKSLRERVTKGEDFHELAKRYSEGSTAKEGGDLGSEGFSRDQLAAEISETVFRMNRNEISEVIRTKTGFLILKVFQRYEAGMQPLEKVENEIQSRLYYEKMRPGLKEFLKTLREQNYVFVKPGFTDASAVTVMPIEEVQPPAPEDEEKKKKRRKILWIF